jgi:hypothetical protein
MKCLVDKRVSIVIWSHDGPISILIIIIIVLKIYRIYFWRDKIFYSFMIRACDCMFTNPVRLSITYNQFC